VQRRAETPSIWRAVEAYRTALATVPGDLPARTAGAFRAAAHWCDGRCDCQPGEHDVVVTGIDGDARIARVEGSPEGLARVAVGVSGEDVVATVAKNAQLRRSLDEARGNADVYGQKMLQAQNERDKARRELAETREKLAELRDLQVGIKSLTTENGGIDMSLHMAHDMMRACVAGFVKILDSVDAPNYVELAYSLRNDPERYTVVIQRPRGKTPAEVAGEAKRQAREAEAERDRLRARLTGVAIHARRLDARTAPFGSDAWLILRDLFAALEAPAQATTEDATDEH
jgi:hypothetical protein